jgi:TPR repeat protein
MKRTFYIIVILAACATLLLSDFRDPQSEVALGQNYETGNGVPRDPVRAAAWYQRAARQGNPVGQLYVADMYATGGDGQPKDDARARYWYEKAARQDNADAQLRLALLYLKGGDGVAQNDTEALHWLARAAALGQPEAQYNYGLMYSRGRGVPRSEVEAVKWYRSAADKGLPAAQYAIGRAYYLGAGVAQDSTRAAVWFFKAADQNMAEAQFNLAVLYEKGYGVPESRIEAAKWYGRAAANGIDTALRAAWLQDTPLNAPALPVAMNLPPPSNQTQEPAVMRTATGAPMTLLPTVIRHHRRTTVRRKGPTFDLMRLADEIMRFRIHPTGQHLVYERIAADRMAGTEIGINAAD